MKTFDCVFSVSAKISRPLRSRNIEAAVWSVLDEVFKSCRFGCLKNGNATIDHIIEHMGDGTERRYAGASLARTDDGRLAAYDVVVSVAGVAHVVVDAEDKKDADARGREYVLSTADVGDLRCFQDFSVRLVSAAEVPSA